MTPDEFNCQFYGTDCPSSISTWVAGDKVATMFVNIVLLLVLLVLLGWTLWYFLSYRRRPFCVDCRRHDINRRTKYRFKGDPVCGHHYDERDMASEPVRQCPEHKGIDLVKVKRAGITIDRCPHGCIFLDDGEIHHIEEEARGSGQTTGMVIGMAIG